jgi:hypothetical protein
MEVICDICKKKVCEENIFMISYRRKKEFVRICEKCMEKQGMIKRR